MTKEFRLHPVFYEESGERSDFFNDEGWNSLVNEVKTHFKGERQAVLQGLPEGSMPYGVYAAIGSSVTESKTLPYNSQYPQGAAFNLEAGLFPEEYEVEGTLPFLIWNCDPLTGGTPLDLVVAAKDLPLWQQYFGITVWPDHISVSDKMIRQDQESGRIGD